MRGRGSHNRRKRVMAPEPQTVEDKARAALGKMYRILRTLQDNPSPGIAVGHMHLGTVSCRKLKHWNMIRLLPDSVSPSYIECFIPEAQIPLTELNRLIIKPLGDFGYSVGDTVTHPCGCVSFPVRPRRLAPSR
jgi:hypothetical protein